MFLYSVHKVCMHTLGTKLRAARPKADVPMSGTVARVA
jgi:hypothetical protein